MMEEEEELLMEEMLDEEEEESESDEPGTTTQDMIDKINTIFTSDEHDLEKTISMVKDSSELITLIG